MTKLTTEELREPWCLKCGRKASDHNVRHPFQPSHELPSIHDLAAENAALRAEVEKSRVIIEALKGQLAGKPSNPPKTGRKPSALGEGGE